MKIEISRRNFLIGAGAVAVVGPQLSLIEQAVAASPASYPITAQLVSINGRGLSEIVGVFQQLDEYCATFQTMKETFDITETGCAEAVQICVNGEPICKIPLSGGVVNLCNGDTAKLCDIFIDGNWNI